MRGEGTGGAAGLCLPGGRTGHSATWCRLQLERVCRLSGQKAGSLGSSQALPEATGGQAGPGAAGRSQRAAGGRTERGRRPPQHRCAFGGAWGHPGGTEQTRLAAGPAMDAPQPAVALAGPGPAP